MFTVPESPDLYLVIYVMVPALEQVTLIASDWRGRGAHCLQIIPKRSHWL